MLFLLLLLMILLLLFLLLQWDSKVQQERAMASHRKEYKPLYCDTSYIRALKDVQRWPDTQGQGNIHDSNIPLSRQVIGSAKDETSLRTMDDVNVFYRGFVLPPPPLTSCSSGRGWRRWASMRRQLSGPTCAGMAMTEEAQLYATQGREAPGVWPRLWDGRQEVCPRAQDLGREGGQEPQQPVGQDNILIHLWT